MKNLIFLFALAATPTTTLYAVCACLFSFTIQFETVTFTNYSNVSNAQYFWNFGDGTGSDFENPIHKFPDTGKYLVTLFTTDTISKCSSYYECWIDVTKPSNDSCQPGVITDSIFFDGEEYFVRVIEKSTNCSYYSKSIDCGPGQNFNPDSRFLIRDWQHAKFLSRVKYFTFDTINGVVYHRERYRTCPFRYTSSKNYNDCSANFEFTVVSQNDEGQRVLFKAMNKTATKYEWEIVGFGGPGVSKNDTISRFYPFTVNNFWLVGLKTTGSSVCKDTLYQTILIQNITQTTMGVKAYESDNSFLSIYPNPAGNILSFKSGTIKESEKVNLQVVNMFGQTIFQENNFFLWQSLDVSDVAHGVYFVEVSRGSLKFSTKFVKLQN